MYGLVSENTLRLVYEAFYLAIYSLIHDLQITHFQLCCISNGSYKLFSPIGREAPLLAFYENIKLLKMTAGDDLSDHPKTCRVPS